MEAKRLKELKKGDYFTLKPVEYAQDNEVWVRGEYDRSSRKYSIYKFSDINHESFKSGNTKVYTDFIF